MANTAHLAHYFSKATKQSSNGSDINKHTSHASPEESNQLYDQIANEIGSLVHFEATDSVFEIGCGSGEILQRIAQQVSIAQGIDISQDMVDLARQKQLDVQWYDQVSALSHADYTIIYLYSVIINIDSLSYVRKLITRAFDLVKPGGKLLIGDIPDPDNNPFFPTHHSLRGMQLRWRQRCFPFFRKDEIHCFSYPYDFFTDLNRTLCAQKLEFVRSRLSFKGWNKRKYYVLFHK